MTTVSLSRDPFARTTLERTSVETKDSCANCGRKRRSGKLFSYANVADTIYPRPRRLSPLFCSKGCYETYS